MQTSLVSTPRPADSSATPPGAACADPRRRTTDHAALECMALVLDEIDYGVILVDAQHRVAHANHAALAQLRRSAWVLLAAGELRAADARQGLALNAAIRAAATQGLRRLVNLGEGSERIAVAIIPLPRHQPNDEARVLLLLSRRHICEELSAHGFASGHGLTSAEGQVFKALCRGLEPAQIASEVGVKLSTVRTQIASIRLKAEVASIGALVHRVAQLPPLVSALRDDVRLCA